jgi:hypothetical protein
MHLSREDGDYALGNSPNYVLNLGISCLRRHECELRVRFARGGLERLVAKSQDVLREPAANLVENLRRTFRGYLCGYRHVSEGSRMT